MYFVSFVLTAQFVLINVVVAVLMKHLDDSNKEAQEDAEMDAEIEMELAQGGLCCLGGLDRPTGADGGERPAGGFGNRQAAMASVHSHTSTSQSGFTQNQRLYSPAQVRLAVTDTPSDASVVMLLQSLGVAQTSGLQCYDALSLTSTSRWSYRGRY